MKSALSSDTALADLKRLVTAHGVAAIPMFGIITDYPEPNVNICSCSAVECGQPGKHPRIRWGELIRPPAWGQLEEWTRRLSNFAFDPFNWAFRCDLSQVVVVDIDPRNGGIESWQQLVDRFGAPPPTARDRVATRGWHEWFRAPADPTAIANPGQGKLELAPGVDLKYGKGYVIGPPSMHRCGSPYRWDDGAAPWQTDFAPLPSWIIDLANEIEGGRAKKRAEKSGSCASSAADARRMSSTASHSYCTSGTSTDARHRLLHRARSYVSRIPGAVSGRNGSRVTAHVACVLLNDFALAFDDALAVFAEWNATCSPPWSRAELARKLDWASTQGGTRGRLADSSQSEWQPQRGEIERELAAAGIDIESFAGGGERKEPAEATAGPATANAANAAHAAHIDTCNRIAAHLDELDAAPSAAICAEAAAAAHIRAARRDFDRYPCPFCRFPVNQDLGTGAIMVRKVRCEKRNRCIGCRAYLDERETANAQLRFATAEKAGQQLYAGLVADADWRKVRRRITSSNCSYLAVATTNDLGEPAWYLVSTSPLAGDPLPSTAALESFRSRLSAYTGDCARPVRACHAWALPDLCQQDGNEIRLGMGDPTLTTERVCEIAEACGAFAVPRGAHRGNPRIQWTLGIMPPDADARERIVDALFLGELLPDIDPADWSGGLGGLDAHRGPNQADCRGPSPGEGSFAEDLCFAETG